MGERVLCVLASTFLINKLHQRNLLLYSGIYHENSIFTPAQVKHCSKDPIFGVEYMREVYFKASPGIVL